MQLKWIAVAAVLLVLVFVGAILWPILFNVESPPLTFSTEPNRLASGELIQALDSPALYTTMGNPIYASFQQGTKLDSAVIKKRVQEGSFFTDFEICPLLGEFSNDPDFTQNNQSIQYNGTNETKAQYGSICDRGEELSKDVQDSNLQELINVNECGCAHGAQTCCIIALRKKQ